MQYDMLTTKQAKRLWNTFQSHTCFINKNYRAFAKEHDGWYTDRDRLVGRLAPRLLGRYFVLADREVIAYRYDGYVQMVDKESAYSSRHSSYRTNYMGEPVCMRTKKYLHVSYLRAVNEMYGQGFIEMECSDVFGDRFSIRLDWDTLRNIQFKEIAKEEFDRVAGLFVDDRDDREFLVTRYLGDEEMKKRRKSTRKGLVKEQVTVMAKDCDEAMKKVENAIEVEVCQ